MKKLLLILLSIFLLPTDYTRCNNSDCLSPTEYVFHFLKKSGTVWTGSRDWKNQLQNGKTIHTNYMSIRDGSLFEYAGFAISGHDCYSKVGKVPVDTLKAYFEITQEGDTIKIKSHIEDTEVRKNLKNHEIEELERAARMCASGPNKATDFCSQSIATCALDLDKNARISRVTLVSNCESVIPVQLFMQQMAR